MCHIAINENDFFFFSYLRDGWQGAGLVSVEAAFVGEVLGCVAAGEPRAQRGLGFASHGRNKIGQRNRNLFLARFWKNFNFLIEVNLISSNLHLENEQTFKGKLEYVKKCWKSFTVIVPRRGLNIFFYLNIMGEQLSVQYIGLS